MVDVEYVKGLGINIAEELEYFAKRVNEADKIISKAYELAFYPPTDHVEACKKIDGIQRLLKRYSKKYVV